MSLGCSYGHWAPFIATTGPPTRPGNPFGPANAIDGDESTFWMPAQLPKAGAPNFITLDMTCLDSHMTMLWHAEPCRTHDYIQHFEIQESKTREGLCSSIVQEKVHWMKPFAKLMTLNWLIQHQHFQPPTCRYDVLFCGFRINWRRPPVQFYAECPWSGFTSMELWMCHCHY